ncbi:MAG: MBL fold metallo-hydrolase, partial [Chloroflexi bacterium]|nr:MBL fold metallo-hydrolase [Chloroflexota bacterium]
WVTRPEGVLLIDAPAHEENPGGATPIPNYSPPPPIEAQLQAAGVPPEAVTHLVITHAHWDHFNGLTRQVEGEDRPIYPNAIHYLGRGDWERIQPELADAQSRQNRTLGAVDRVGLLRLVDGEMEILPGVRIIPAPGESPGHQIVRIEEADGILYHVGDLYHHVLEVARPEWACHWAEAEAHKASRATFLAAALAEDARVLASHIANFGRIRVTESGMAWERV